MAQTVKSLPAMQETEVPPLGWENPLEKDMATTPVFLPRKSHGWRSLAGYSPWDHKESDMTERLCPVSMGFSRQEYWSGLPFLSPGDLPDPGIKPGSPAL